jgi:hypothetical protein
MNTRRWWKITYRNALLIFVISLIWYFIYPAPEYTGQIEWQIHITNDAVKTIILPWPNYFNIWINPLGFILLMVWIYYILAPPLSWMSKIMGTKDSKPKDLLSGLLTSCLFIIGVAFLGICNISPGLSCVITLILYSFIICFLFFIILCFATIVCLTKKAFWQKIWRGLIWCKNFITGN